MPNDRQPMLEVAIAAHRLLHWEWQVLDGTEIVRSGFKNTRSEAKYEGESAMFQILASRWFSNDQPWLP